MGRQQRRKTHARSTELAPEELFVPQATRVNDEWASNNARLNYRMARAGLPGRLLVLAVVGYFVFGLIFAVVRWVSSL